MGVVGKQGVVASMVPTIAPQLYNKQIGDNAQLQRRDCSENAADAQCGASDHANSCHSMMRENSRVVGSGEKGREGIAG